MDLNDSIRSIRDMFYKYCKKRNYTIKILEKENHIRLEISNLKDRININIYYTGSILIQGRESSLLREFKELKRSYEENPQQFISSHKSSKVCSIRYNILLQDERKK